MKNLLCFIVALLAPGVTMAVVDAVPPPLSQTTVTGSSGKPAKPHHLLDLKFVLVRPPQDQQALPQIDMVDRRAAIVPVSPKSRAEPVRGLYVNPNMYWCTAWGCMPGTY